jgi:dCMP deaminase
MADWGQRYVDTARFVATWSKDRNTKVGAVIFDPVHQSILSVGYNGFPRGVNDDVDARHSKEFKYAYTEHAERNAIFNAARHGTRLQGMGIAVDWFPCADCARAIIQSGITVMFAHRPDLTPGGRWVDSHIAAATMLREADVTVHYLEDVEAAHA